MSAVQGLLAVLFLVPPTPQEPESPPVVEFPGISIPLPEGYTVVSATDREVRIRKWIYEGGNESIQARLIHFDADSPPDLLTEAGLREALKLWKELSARSEGRLVSGTWIPLVLLKYRDEEGRILTGHCLMAATPGGFVVVEAMTIYAAPTEPEVFTLYHAIPRLPPPKPPPEWLMMFIGVLFAAGWCLTLVGWLWTAFGAARQGDGGYAIVIMLVPIAGLVYTVDRKDMAWNFRTLTAGIILLILAFLTQRILL